MLRNECYVFMFGIFKDRHCNCSLLAQNSACGSVRGRYCLHYVNSTLFLQNISAPPDYSARCQNNRPHQVSSLEK